MPIYDYIALSIAIVVVIIIVYLVLKTIFTELTEDIIDGISTIICKEFSLKTIRWLEHIIPIIIIIIIISVIRSLVIICSLG